MPSFDSVVKSETFAKMIIDTHAHISDPRFDSDREAIIQRALVAGVGKIFEISCEMCHWDKALELSKRDNIFVVFGIHPVEVPKALPEDYKKLESMIQDEKCIAVGEIGLDYHYNFSCDSIEIQKEAFVKQLDIAVRFNKPIVIHCRNAYDDMIDFLVKYKHIPKGVVHCFSGDARQAKAFVEAGFLLGIDGPLTYKNSSNLKQVVLETDISKLLAETDCPYLTPQKYRGQRNEPSYITEVLKEIAAIKNISFKEASHITALNALKLFGISD